MLSSTGRGRGGDAPARWELHQQPLKNAVRKSKKSWELVAPEWLKSARGPPAALKKSSRKSKKSVELRRPSVFQSARQVGHARHWARRPGGHVAGAGERSCDPQGAPRAVVVLGHGVDLER
jgi:hypothetical protein